MSHLKRSACLAAFFAVASPMLAFAGTVSVSPIFPLSSQFDDFSSPRGGPLDLTFTYDDGGVTAASYAVGGRPGSFQSATLGAFFDSGTSAYGRTGAAGVLLSFTMDFAGVGDGLPMTPELRAFTVKFAAKPGHVAIPGLAGAGGAPMTEANLDDFFQDGTTELALSFLYFNGSTNRTYEGAFTPFTLNAPVSGGGTGGSDPQNGVSSVPLPASGLLLFAGLGALASRGRAARRAR